MPPLAGVIFCDTSRLRHFERARQFQSKRYAKAFLARLSWPSAEVLLETCGHHRPDFLHGAVNGMTSRHRFWCLKRAAGLESAREKRQKAPENTWSEWQDLNLRPLRPERSALPG